MRNVSFFLFLEFGHPNKVSQNLYANLNPALDQPLGNWRLNPKIRTYVENIYLCNAL